MRTHHRILTPALTAIALASAAPADTTYYVRTSGNNSNSGLTPTLAFRTIQHSVASCSAAGGGYTIYVGPGTYGETVQVGTGGGAAARSGTSGNPNRLIADSSGAHTGDAAGPVTVSGSGSHQYGIQHSTLDYWTYAGLTIQGQTDASIYQSSGRGLVIEGCTLHATPSWTLMLYPSGDLRVQDNTVVRTGASGHGILVYGSTGGAYSVSRNRLSMTGAAYLSSPFRTGGSGGGWQSSFAILALAFSGGGSVSVTVENNTISDAYVGVYAYVQGTTRTAVVSSNTITGCYFPAYLFSTGSAKMRATNNIVAQNYYPLYGSLPSGSNTTLNGVLEYGNVQSSHGSMPAITNLLTGDPLFTAAAAGDFTPMTGSPAIDAGTAGVIAPTSDLLGAARPADGDGNGTALHDFGAFEAAAGAPQLRVIEWKETNPR